MTTFEVISAIKARMKELGCSQEKLGERIGVNRATVQRWLAYETNIPAYSMFSVLHALGLDMQIVYGNGESDER